MTSTAADATSTRTDEASTAAGSTSTGANVTSTQVREVSTAANMTSTRAEATSTRADEASTGANVTSTRAEVTSTGAVLVILSKSPCSFAIFVNTWKHVPALSLRFMRLKEC